MSQKCNWLVNGFQKWKLITTMCPSFSAHNWENKQKTVADRLRN